VSLTRFLCYKAQSAYIQFLLFAVHPIKRHKITYHELSILYTKRTRAKHKQQIARKKHLCWGLSLIGMQKPINLRLNRLAHTKRRQHIKPKRKWRKLEPRVARWIWLYLNAHGHAASLAFGYNLGRLLWALKDPFLTLLKYLLSSFFTILRAIWSLVKQLLLITSLLGWVKMLSFGYYCLFLYCILLCITLTTVRILVYIIQRWEGSQRIPILIFWSWVTPHFLNVLLDSPWMQGPVRKFLLLWIAETIMDIDEYLKFSNFVLLCLGCMVPVVMLYCIGSLYYLF
jgi:hypothetical protein